MTFVETSQMRKKHALMKWKRVAQEKEPEMAVDRKADNMEKGLLMLEISLANRIKRTQQQFVNSLTQLALS